MSLLATLKTANGQVAMTEAKRAVATVVVGGGIAYGLHKIGLNGGAKCAAVVTGLAVGGNVYSGISALMSDD